MYARGRGLRPETVEAVETIWRIDPDGELPIEDVVWVADQFGACPDAVLLLSRLVMCADDLHYGPFSDRYSWPMHVWSREAARAVLATGLPIDDVEFRDVYGTDLSPDDLYLIGYGGLDDDLPEISTAKDVLGSLEDQRAEEKAEQAVQQTFKQAA